MKHSPTLFNAAMVRAILQGRKKQTRRIVSEKSPVHKIGYFLGRQTYKYNFWSKERPISNLSPYGGPGDRLWGRETWRPCAWSEGFHAVEIEYRAGGADGIKFTHVLDSYDIWGDDSEIVFEKLVKEIESAGTKKNEDGNFILIGKSELPIKWKPSIFMPKAISRLNLLVNGSKLERLHDITPRDIVEEGAFEWDLSIPMMPADEARAFEAWIKLWDSINGKKYPWESSNPLVWATSFE